MTLWPTSLLWRTTLLIALLLIATQAGSILLITETAPAATPRELASRAARLIGDMHRAASQTSPREERAILEQIAAAGDARLLAAAEARPPETRVPRPFLNNAARWLRKEFGTDVPLAFQPGGGGQLWVGFDTATGRYWLVLSRIPEKPDPLDDWHLWLAALLATAGVAGFLISAHVSRPLKHLGAAASRIAVGEQVEAVPETGPAETRLLARSFNQMAGALRQAEADRALLLAGVSHDLRTPLARLRLGLELLPADDPKLTVEMERDIALIDAVLGQFLAYVRGQSSEPVIPNCDLNELARETAGRHHDWDPPILVATVDLPPMPLRPVAMQRLIENLLENARKYGAPPLEVHTGLIDGQATLAVVDRGPGLPQTALAQVLQPFHRLDPSRSSPGAGLGLAIAERIAQLHGGRLLLSNRPGGGLEAKLWLPLPLSSGPSAKDL